MKDLVQNFLASPLRDVALPQHNDKTYGLRYHAKLKSFHLSLIPTQSVAKNKHYNHPLAAEDIVSWRLLTWHEMMRSRWCQRCSVKKILQKVRCRKDTSKNNGKCNFGVVNFARKMGLLIG